MGRQSQGSWWMEHNYPPCMIQQPGIMTVDSQYQIFFNDLLSCVYQVFQFDGLPDSVDQTYFKMCLFLGGRVAVFRDTKGTGEIRALQSAEAGFYDVYYMPEKVIIVNPTFKGYSYTLKFQKDVAVIFCRECDRYQYGMETGGLFGLISSTAQLLAENTISINVATKNMRLVNILGAEDENTKTSLDLAVNSMYDGKPYVAVLKSLVDKLESLPLTDKTDTGQLIQLLQTRQYIYAHFYECIGLKTHDQMKKERLITSEIDEGTELAVFNVQDMLQEIQRGIDVANRIFDLDITLRLHPLITGTLEDPSAADPEAEDQTDGEPEEPAAEDQTDGEPAEQDDGSVDDDQTDGEPEDEDQTDGSVDDDQTDGEPAEQDDGSVDDDQTDGEPEEPEAADQSVSVVISGSVTGDVYVDIIADQQPTEATETAEETPGGEENVVTV